MNVYFSNIDPLYTITNENKKSNIVIVGSGISGATCASKLNEVSQGRYNIIVLEKRHHIAGNCYTEPIDQFTNVHKYGAHIFHTDKQHVWDFVNQHSKFDCYNHTVLAMNGDELFTMPFGLKLLNEVYGFVDREELRECMSKELSEHPVYSKYSKPFPQYKKSLESYSVLNFGTRIYDKIIKEYSFKMWGVPPDELPEDYIKRIPFRDDYRTNYFSDQYQGLPVGGYTKMVESMLTSDNIHLVVGYDYLKNKREINNTFHPHFTIFTGAMDEYFEYNMGVLPYRSIEFTDVKSKTSQGCSVINHTGNTKHTRTVEHTMLTTNPFKRDEYLQTSETPIQFDISISDPKHVRMYPIKSKDAESVADKYRTKIEKLKENNIYFTGRLAQYKYMDMEQAIHEACNTAYAISLKL